MTNAPTTHAPSGNHNAARERVLAAAEQLFARHGYTAVTLRDIAATVGIRHTSLYHHVPGGKEALYVEVMERHLQRHAQGLRAAIAAAAPTVEAQLYAIADWLLSQPPMDMLRMTYTDLPAIDPAHAAHLTTATYEAMLVPIEEVLAVARERGELDHADIALVAGGLFGVIESIHAVPPMALTQPRPQMARAIIDVMLNGVRPRPR